MYKFLIPFYYTFKYNRKGFEGIAYFLEYPIFILMFNYISTKSLVLVITSGLLLINTILIYEIGYMQNNVFAIKYEINPTIRHSNEEIKYISKNYQKIVLYRVVIYILLLNFMLYKNNLNNKEAIMFVGLSIILYYVYYLYNFKFRKGIFNRLIFIILRFLRYYMPFFFYSQWYISCLVICVLNLINNYSWYNRTKITLPSFFGTKLFDLFYYLNIMYFLKKQEFLIMIVIKFILILLIYPQKIKNNLKAIKN